jgi:20S proteasome alpha/beta subunit
MKIKLTFRRDLNMSAVNLEIIKILYEYESDYSPRIVFSGIDGRCYIYYFDQIGTMLIEE